MKPPNETGALLYAPVPNLQPQGAYQLPHFLQPLGKGTNSEVKRRGFFHQESCQCVCCARRISNRVLGGYSGRSALTGLLWCLSCADYASQLLLRFGGAVR
jgi:hypothetical protein